MSRVSQRALDSATVIIAAIAVFVAISVATTIGSTPAQAGAEDLFIPDWKVLLDEARWRGPTTAPVVLVEFGDYECPWCRQSEPHIKALQRKYPDNVALVYRHFPLRNHRYAYPAAVAAECALEQQRFWQAHEFLFSVADLSLVNATTLAAGAGIPDEGELRDCMATMGPAERVDSDLAMAQDLGLRGTPSFIVNGIYLSSNADSTRFFELVDSLLALR